MAALMKLILTQDVTGLGAPGDVVEVAPGYGRNYLVPQGLAIQATRGAEKQIATIRRAREVREVRDLGHAKQIQGQLAGLQVRLPARSGDGGRLFGSITSADVVAAGPVRALAVHPTEFTFASGSTGSIKQWKCPEGAFMQNFEGQNAIINTLSVNQNNVFFSGGEHSSIPSLTQLPYCV